MPKMHQIRYAARLRPALLGKLMPLATMGAYF